MLCLQRAGTGSLSGFNFIVGRTILRCSHGGARCCLEVLIGRESEVGGRKTRVGYELKVNNKKNQSRKNTL